MTTCADSRDVLNPKNKSIAGEHQRCNHCRSCKGAADFVAILSAVALVVVRSDIVDAAGIDIAVVFERVTKKGNVAFVNIFTVDTVSAGTNIPGTKKGTISVDAEFRSCSQQCRICQCYRE